jgi:hypothetical protein
MLLAAVLAILEASRDVSMVALRGHQGGVKPPGVAGCCRKTAQTGGIHVPMFNN